MQICQKYFLMFNIYTAQINEFFYYRFLQEKWPNPQETADLIKFTEEILNGKFYFLCNVIFT